MEKILVSACLLGEKTKYDGGDNLVEGLQGLLEFFELVPYCPEVGGGLPVPRVPAERKGNWVINKEGVDVTSAYTEGAEKALRLCKTLGITLAILKQNSPACGSKQIYDGYFRGRKIPGQGVTAALLSSNGIRVMDEEEGLALLDSKLSRKKKHEEIIEQKKEEAKLREEKEAAKARFAKRGAPRNKFGSKSRKPYAKKEEGEDKKPFRKRKPYAKRTEGESKSPNRFKKPYGPKKSFSSKKPYRPKKADHKE